MAARAAASDIGRAPGSGRDSETPPGLDGVATLVLVFPHPAAASDTAKAMKADRCRTSQV
jgi:hypothetical protein